LSVGAAAGLAWAGLGLFDAVAVTPDRSRSGVMARVNGRVLTVDDYERRLAEQSGDAPADVATRRRVLDEMLDEELLVQRGLALGLAYKEPRVRREIGAAVGFEAIAEAGSPAIDDDTLGRFFDENRGQFAAAERRQLRQIYCRADGDPQAAQARCHEAARRLRDGEDFDRVRAALGSTEPSALPSLPLERARLEAYLDQEAARAVFRLRAGEVSDPLRDGHGCRIVQVVASQDAIDVRLEQVEPEVRAVYRGRMQEAALRAYLDRLRRRARIELAVSGGVRSGGRAPRRRRPGR